MKNNKINKIISDENGYTLIEMMSVLLISTIIALSSGIIVVSSYRFMKQVADKTKLQREVNFTSDLLGKYIREGDVTNYQIFSEFNGIATTQGSCLSLEDYEGNIIQIFERNSSLWIKQNSNPPNILIADIINSLQYTALSLNVIQVSTNLVYSNYCISNNTKYVFRN